MSEHILVIGATLMDIKGKPTAGLEPSTSNPAEIRHTRGGTGRNVAENLARLGADVVLISAVADDQSGQQLVSQTAKAGVNVEYVLSEAGYNCGSYIALLDEDGSLSVALDDVTVMETITDKYLNKNKNLFRDACLIMFDGSLTTSAMAKVANLAHGYGVRLCADPSSTRLAYKLRPHLYGLHLIVPNEVEAAGLMQTDFGGYDPDASLEIALLMRSAGVRTAIVTLSDFGLVYATSDETGYIPARYRKMVDTTGTGDAITAATIFGMINDLPTIESIRLGAAAASINLQTNETVVPDLSLDMLYDHLIV